MESSGSCQKSSLANVQPERHDSETCNVTEQELGKKDFYNNKLQDTQSSIDKGCEEDSPSRYKLNIDVDLRKGSTSNESCNNLQIAPPSRLHSVRGKKKYSIPNSSLNSNQHQHQAGKYTKPTKIDNASSQPSFASTNDGTPATNQSNSIRYGANDDKPDYDEYDEDNNGECSRRNSHSKPELNLLYCSLERIKLKDFGCEIRALMDVEQFVHQAILLLDVADIIVEDIVDSMLRKIISIDREISQCVINEAKNALFINKSASLLSRTLQGIQISTDPMLAEIDYDQSWLCSICNLPTINKRHVAIARLKHFVNMGKNAHEVRFFIMIVTPSKEKGTKNALETGRTFATIFSDINFRQILLNAPNESEFKQALLSYTKKLTNVNSVIIDSYNNEVTSSSPDHHMQHLSINSNYDQSHQQQQAFMNIVENRLSSLVPDGEYANIKDSIKTLAPDDGEYANIKDSIKTLAEPQQYDDVETNDGLARPSLTASSTITHLDSGHTHKAAKKSVFLKLNSLDYNKRKYFIGNGLCKDFKRRHKFYFSDFTDGFTGAKTVQKTISTIVFLYFGILLPTIAFGVLNTTNTNGNLGDIRKAIIGQSIGGFLFALLGGQPLVIIMTTAPLCLYTKVIYTMCEDYNYPFLPMYATVGLWNAFFMILYSVFDVSRLMKWCTRSTEEIFALFIAMAFCVDAGRDLIKNFNRYYYSNACLHDIEHNYTSSSNKFDQIQSSFADNNVTKGIFDMEPVCRRESSLLFIVLMFGTLWLALALYNFNRTPYLQASKREILADYALPTAVIVMTFVGSYVFEEIQLEKFSIIGDITFTRARLHELPLVGQLVAMGLGFTLSLLFFMDQNISAAMVNSPQNKLKKGCAYHYDLLVVGILNGLLTLYGLPMMHGVLPHSPLHVRSLADVEERVEQGHVKHIIINVRETRITGLVAHALICMSIFLIPYPIAYIPTAVLDGLFLYVAATSLDGLQMFERITLLFMEQSAYPPNHYIRRCPQRKIHEFTLVQLFQLTVMCFFGFSPSNTIEMFFPVVILLMLPFRNKLVPHYIEEKYLEALDGKH